MTCGTSNRVGLVRTDVSEKVSYPSGFLRLIGLHSLCYRGMTVDRLCIEGYYVGSKNTVLLWSVSGTLYRVALVRNGVSENISPPTSGFLRMIGPHNV
jgi:hypothetical protein